MTLEGVFHTTLYCIAGWQLLWWLVSAIKMVRGKPKEKVKEVNEMEEVEDE